jgi:hypothetical protein
MKLNFVMMVTGHLAESYYGQAESCYLNEHDEVGVCGFCNELSYKDHQPDCPVKIAQDIIEERR